MSTTIKKPQPIYTIDFTRVGQIDTPPQSVECKGGVLEALVWFHLEQQLRAGLAPDAYTVLQVTATVAGSSGVQRRRQDELPPSNLLSKVTLSKKMAKNFELELGRFKAAGGFYSVA